MSRIKIEDINTTSGTQVRVEINEETVSLYHDAMVDGAKFPPVDVFHDGTSYHLADGFHRVMAANRVGYIEIDATIHKGTAQDALWFAIGANRTNGQTLTRGDRRKAIEAALRAFPDKTQEAIAKQVGCAIGYVNKIKGELFTSEKLPDAPATVTGKDGKTYPTSKTRKPKRPTTPEQEENMYLGPPKDDNKRLPARRGPPLIPCNGMQFARMAIMDLEQIEKNDKERKEAFEYVKEWINENE